MKKFVFVLMVISILFISCNETEVKAPVKENPAVTISDLKDVELTQNENLLISDFGLDILKQTFNGKNIMISPFSILSAMAMTENGAANNTLKQMEEVFQMDKNVMNKYFKTYYEKKKDENLFIANSIWIKDAPDLIVEDQFIQENKEYYHSEIYKEDFSGKTLKNINNWVYEKTDEMIEDILEEIHKDAVMYLVNAICFKDKWEKEYLESQVFEAEFTLENGEKKPITMMRSEEEVYLEDESAKGMIKYYKDRKYAFIALLPSENIKMKDYIDSLDAKKIQSLIENKQEEPIMVNLPKFKSAYSVKLQAVLKTMGITDAFDEEKADFSLLGYSPEGNIFISKVIHKTFIEVDEKGTKAAAATVVEMTKEEALFESKEISFDRPFIYMIYDVENELPIFIGIEMNV